MTQIKHKQLKPYKQNKINEKLKLHPIVKELGIVDPLFSVKLSKCLIKANIETLEQLLEKDSYDLLQTPNLGRKSLHTIITALNKKGLKLREYSSDRHKSFLEKHLPIRTVHAMERLNITLDKLIHMSDEELFHMPYLGKIYVQQTRECINRIKEMKKYTE